jgi:hypothetical protein
MPMPIICDWEYEGCMMGRRTPPQGISGQQYCLIRLQNRWLPGIRDGSGWYKEKEMIMDLPSGEQRYG